MTKFNALKLVQFIVIIGIILSGGLCFNNLKKQNIIEKERLQAIHEEEVNKLKVEKECYVQKLVHKDNEVNEYKEKLQINNEKFENISVECANLENTIKQLAFVGKKPKNYRIADKIDRGSFSELYDKLEYVGEWLGTYYAPTKEECGNNKGLTASGKPVTAGHTIAVDKQYWELGTLFYLEGYGVCEAIDTGSAILGKERLDYCVFSEDISHSGNFKVNVWLINK
jgi:3D (Asp-Asp-Asp) domain-containing protein